MDPTQPQSNQPPIQTPTPQPTQLFQPQVYAQPVGQVIQPTPVTSTEAAPQPATFYAPPVAAAPVTSNPMATQPVVLEQQPTPMFQPQATSFMGQTAITNPTFMPPETLVPKKSHKKLIIGLVLLITAGAVWFLTQKNDATWATTDTKTTTSAVDAASKALNLQTRDSAAFSMLMPSGYTEQEAYDPQTFVYIDKSVATAGMRPTVTVTLWPEAKFQYASGSKTVAERTVLAQQFLTEQLATLTGYVKNGTQTTVTHAAGPAFTYTADVVGGDGKALGKGYMEIIGTDKGVVEIAFSPRESADLVKAMPAIENSFKLK